MNNLIEKILDFIFPKSELVKEIENMSQEELISRSPKLKLSDSDILSVFEYKDPLIKQAIWEIKYRKNRKITELLAKCLYDELLFCLSEKENFQNFHNPILIPVPISKEKMKIRGFNQCEYIASKLMEFSDTNTFTINNKVLIKTTDTQSQTKKNRNQRLNNLKDSFAVTDESKVCGKNIILLDDVTTTGATLKEASKTLKKAGARKIFCVTLAH
jgi:competence protein ComFC